MVPGYLPGMSNLTLTAKAERTVVISARRMECGQSWTMPYYLGGDLELAITVLDPFQYAQSKYDLQMGR